MVCLIINTITMKLELKHLAPYLPYGLVIKVGLATTAEMTLDKNDRGLVDILWVLNNDAYEPYLHPLSDLTKEIPNDRDHVFLPFETLKRLEKNEFHKCSGAKSFIAACELKNVPFSRDKWIAKKLTNCPYWIMQKLFEWHFDVFGLIPSGLALPKK